jgi:hypothetical protein
VPVTGHAVEHRFVRPDIPFDHALVELPPTGRDHTDLFAALRTFDTVDGQVTDDPSGRLSRRHVDSGRWRQIPRLRT